MAGTPIGNLSDASEALRKALAAADIIAAEDTRRLHTLLRGLGVATTARVVSYFDGNEAARAAELLVELQNGANVLVVTDAGMPTVSDPGFRLVNAAITADIPIAIVPGPSAVLVALALSGLPTDRFCFEGFMPRKTGERQRRFAELANERRTMVFFEAPHRLEVFLRDAVAVFGEQRPAAVSRELTKLYEETQRGSLADLAAWAAEGVRGEITICIGGATQLTPLDFDAAVASITARTASGERLSVVAAEIAAATGLSRKELYNAALKKPEL